MSDEKIAALDKRLGLVEFKVDELLEYRKSNQRTLNAILLVAAGILITQFMNFYASGGLQ